MMLIFLLLILLLPYAFLTLVQRVRPGVRIAPETRGKAGLTAFFLFTGAGHFGQTQEMARMLPEWVPYRTELVLITGVLEIAAAIALWLPRWTRAVGIGLILMLLAFLPVNVYAALRRVDFGGHGIGPAYLLARVPFQALLIAWTYWWTVRRHKSAAPAFAAGSRRAGGS